MDSSGEGENAENWEMLSSSINQMQERLASDFPENLTLGTASKLDDYGDDNGLVNGLSHQEKPPVRNGGGPVRTQCPKCGKHMRKGELFGKFLSMFSHAATIASIFNFSPRSDYPFIIRS